MQIIGNIIGSATSADNIGFRGILLTYSATSTGGAIIDGNDIRVGDYGATGYAATVAGIEVGTGNYGFIIRKIIFTMLTNQIQVVMVHMVYILLVLQEIRFLL
ncbi:MAG: hypothetical protein IPL21_08175 [Saprospirales bacterium]|nr:hypothetical protein [Saprospirales bacterium]